MTTSPGEILRKAREQKRLTIEQAAFATHIKPEYLKALELDERELLPSDVQGKGFLRLYSGYLDLDTKSLLLLWDGTIQELPLSNEQAPEAMDSLSENPWKHYADMRSNNHSTETPFPEKTENSLEEHFEVEEITEIQHETQQFTQADWHFQRFGNKLRERRQLLGLQYQDVEKYIHVRKHYLQALEDGHIDAIPSFVQCQGMLANYARFLDLDENDILLDYANGLQARREALAESSAQPQKKKKNKPLITVPKKWKRLISTDLLMVGGIIFILLVFAVWSATRITALKKSDPQLTQLSVSDILLNTSLPTALPTSTSFVFTPAFIGGETQVPGMLLNTPDPNLTPTPLNTSAIQISITAKQRCWVKIIADHENTFNGYLIPGNVYPFYATKELSLISGNAGCLLVTFNQKDLGELGGKTQTIHLLFTEQGLIQPTEVPQTIVPTETMINTTQTITPTIQLTPTVTPLVP